MNVDDALAWFVFLCLLALFVAYGVRLIQHGIARSARADQDGGSVLVPKRLMEMFHWMVTPTGAWFARYKITANHITWASLALGFGSGVALSVGLPGLCVLLGALSAIGDALDGYIARATGLASNAGEVLDATVDRCNEFFFLAGACFLFRGNPWALALALFAILASFMGSYTTAKAESLQLPAPRGSIRRTERSVLTLGGVMLCPLLEAPCHAVSLSRLFPLEVALFILALLGNGSWVLRMMVLYRRVAPSHLPASRTDQEHEPAPTTAPERTC